MTEQDHTSSSASSNSSTLQRVIKKYPNRRLYDTATSTYITLTEVKQLVMEREPIVVKDAKTGEDLTRAIFLQIILEEEAGGAPMFTEAMLANTIRFYGHTMQGHMGSFIEKNVQMFTDFQTKMAEQGGVDAWAKMLQMPNPLMPASYTEQVQKMQEQMQKQTEQMMGMFGIKR
ncbi:MAG: polyhydroxyalkanoate synthesis repressor PhaR [Comamonas sp.]|jgi:polyhydroxyalkanoate synthesis repressor PhaR|nr:polyhydroxyalkanoate synthesis repressor PhaR [Comamonas sp.]